LWRKSFAEKGPSGPLWAGGLGACPAVWFAVKHGQTPVDDVAVCFAGEMLQLPRRPGPGRHLVGALTFKPHLRGCAWRRIAARAGKLATRTPCPAIKPPSYPQQRRLASSVTDGGGPILASTAGDVPEGGTHDRSGGRASGTSRHYYKMQSVSRTRLLGISVAGRHSFQALVGLAAAAIRVWGLASGQRAIRI